MKTILKSLLIWILILPFAILNGGFRDKILIPALGERDSFVISGLILMLIIFLLVLALLPKLGKQTNKLYWLMGFVWVGCTLFLETGMQLLSGISFLEILQTYDLSTGNLWSMIVVFIGFAPILVGKSYKFPVCK
ncbi:MAG: hypothetical protein RR341_06235 [Bacteroidales bacterium]